MRTGIAFFLSRFCLPAAMSRSSSGKFFLGFDRNDYPGDAAMKLLRKEFSFTSYWLGNPPGEKSIPVRKRELFARKAGALSAVSTAHFPPAPRRTTLSQARRRRRANPLLRALKKDFLRPVIFWILKKAASTGALRHLPQTLGLCTFRSWFRAGVYAPNPRRRRRSPTLITARFHSRQMKATELSIGSSTILSPSLGCVTPQNSLARKSGVAYAQVWQFVRSPRDKETARHCAATPRTGIATQPPTRHTNSI